ncbi:DNA-binding GntR family transcriptional regulator [Neisseria perflava]|uniref:GntR family transcriptional regulator n=1 Tax=Neisseria perflava TaxID=33053 RepID=UPI00209D3D59|nr:GntR family transcriptional regulator [Neisseria perflava]MCP1771288.1 DNA-binding GntR family transcriptional regulator [Neisseria perflava]
MSKHSTDRKTLMAETLRRRILSMELRPGAVVDEVKLGDEFGISRSPVRELIRQMAAEGYLELEENRAARVSAMGYDALRNFFLAAPLLYTATAQLAAENATAAEIAALKDIQLHVAAAARDGDTEGSVYHNNRFHWEIGKMAHNPYLLPSMERVLIDHARLGKLFYHHEAGKSMQQDAYTAVAQHDEIIAAIEQRDSAAVVRLMREHMELSRRRMTEYVIPSGLEGEIVMS